MGIPYLCKFCLSQVENFETFLNEQIFNVILAKTQDKSFLPQIRSMMQISYDLSYLVHSYI